MNDWIQTFSGKRCHVARTSSDEIDIRDIAHALSNLCRFTGHVRRFYSVAEHSVRVAAICPDEHKLYGLLHDATEAYIGDMATPTKNLPEMAPFRNMEEEIRRSVVCKFFSGDGYPYYAYRIPTAVHRADAILLATEVRDLMGPQAGEWNLEEQPLEAVIRPWPPEVAEFMFLNMFDVLTNKHEATNLLGIWFDHGKVQSELQKMGEKVEA